MRRIEALALLLGPSVLVATFTLGARLDDNHMSAADVRQFCANYRVLWGDPDEDAPPGFAAAGGGSSDEGVPPGVPPERRMLNAAPDNRKDDVRLVFTFSLGLGPQDKSGADAERAIARIHRTAATRCD